MSRPAQIRTVRRMALNPPSLNDVPGAGEVVNAVTDATENSTDAAADAVDTVVEAVVDSVPPPPPGSEATGEVIESIADVAGEAATGTVEATTRGFTVARDVVEDVRDTEVRSDVEGRATVTHNADATATVDFGGRLAVEVDGNEVGVSSDLKDVGDTDVSHTTADTGVFADVDGHHNEAGVTIDIDESETVGTRDGTIGVYAEHDDDRVEGGVFATTDADVGPGGHESNRLFESGVYGERDGDQVRIGTTDDKGEAGDVLHSGVFVQDADGDRTGVGVISDGKMSGDTFEMGTGGVYADVDGERHDMHAEGGVVMADGEVELEGEFDPGPVSVSGRVGVVTEGDDRGTTYARGEHTTETNRAGDDAVDATRGAVDDLNDDVEGVLDGLPHIDGLDDPEVELPDLPADDPTTDPADDDGGSILDALDVPVIVHDALGDPLEDYHDTAMEAVDATDGVMDPNDGNDEDDDSALDNVTEAVGDALGAVGDVVEDLFD